MSSADYADILNASGYDQAALGTMMACGGAAIAFILILAIVAYVFSSIGLMTLAKNKGIENAWLAWIPVGNLYILGKIVETVNIGTWEIPKMELWLPLGVFGLAVFSNIDHVGWIFSIASVVFMGFTLYKLFTKYRPSQAVLYTVLSIVLGLFWVFVFVIRNDQEAA